MKSKEVPMARVFSRKRRRRDDILKASNLELIDAKEDGTFLVTLPSRNDEVVQVGDYTTARILEETERIIAVADKKLATS
jgi:uncharacterized protein (UPF0218 family)